MKKYCYLGGYHREQNGRKFTDNADESDGANSEVGTYKLLVPF